MTGAPIESRRANGTDSRRCRMSPYKPGNGRTCSLPECGRPIKARGYCNRHYLRDVRHGSPTGGSAAHMESDAERLVEMWSRIEKTDGCWIYYGPKTSGYGTHHLGSEGSVRVHRKVYELLVGPIPADMHLDHLCHNADSACRGGTGCPHRACCNPAHLEPVPHAENVRRGAQRRTTCKRGHALTVKVKRSWGIERRCSECYAARSASRSRCRRAS